MSLALSLTAASLAFPHTFCQSCETSSKVAVKMQNNALYGDTLFLKIITSTSFPSKKNLALISNAPASASNPTTENTSKGLGMTKNTMKFT